VTIRVGPWRLVLRLQRRRVLHGDFVLRDNRRSDRYVWWQ
jgi:hypothetical protein